MKFRIHVHSILHDKILAGLVVTLRLDSLNLSQKLSEQTAERLIVIDNEISLAALDLLLDDIVLQALLVAPGSDELTVLHVCLSNLAAEFNAGELCHETVADVVRIMRFVSLGRNDSELNKLRVSDIVQSEEVRSGFLEGRSVLAHC